MTSPDHMLAAAFDRLAEGAVPGRSAFSMVSVATTGLDGRPRLRIVVNRMFLRDPCRLWFNTDLRSPKAAELTADPRIAVLGYDRDAGFQIRIEGLATLHSGVAARPAWAAAADRSRVCYRHAYGPSAPLETPDLGDPTTVMRAPVDPDEGFGNFCAVEVIPTEIDVLHLAQTGHRRCVFRRQNDNWRGSWLAP